MADHQGHPHASAEAIGVTVLPLHILAGGIGLVAGYVALSAAKGGTLHRKSGLLFVCAMATLSLTGAWVAFVNASSVSVIAGLLTFYFVISALLPIPVLAPVVVMLYWLWRLRIGKTSLGVVGVSTPQVRGATK
jgi:uncharacterized membrane protein